MSVKEGSSGFSSLTEASKRESLLREISRFTRELFCICDDEGDGRPAEPGTLRLDKTEQMLIQRGMLQIVLSHHFQKPEIITMLVSCSTSESRSDFQTVRDTMYKYSKKAEDKFFQQAELAFFFLFFAHSQDGQ